MGCFRLGCAYLRKMTQPGHCKISHNLKVKSNLHKNWYFFTTVHETTTRGLITMAFRRRNEGAISPILERQTEVRV